MKRSGAVNPATRMVWEKQDGGVVTSFAVPGKEAKHIAECKRKGWRRRPDCNVEDLPSYEDRAAWRFDPATGRVHVDLAEKARLAALPQSRTVDDRLKALEDRPQ